MSKKLYSTASWKRRIASAQQRELDKTQRRNTSSFKRHHRAPKSIGAKTRTVTLQFPVTFSFVRNPNETIEFLAEFERVASKSNVTLDLQNVSDITIEAITVLTASVRKVKLTRVSGNLPLDAQPRDILLQSGFLEHVKHSQQLGVSGMGKMSHQESKRVEGVLAQKLIHRVTGALTGKAVPCQPAYRALIECMSNTCDHAARTKLESETWWATGYADAKRKAGCFAFFDTGVGIFESRKLGTIRNAYSVVSRLIGIKNNCDILRDILLGKVESSTGLKYRGKGLPSMYNAVQAGRIKSLVIVSNEVFADVGQWRFDILKTKFRGTLLYWET
jgi:hypothetical protein